MLLAERISYSRDEKSESIEAQDARLRTRAAEEGARIVGITADVSVSGDVDMFDRPALGEWLAMDKREEWDELWVTNQDRLSRSEPHFMAFVFKMLEWNKEIHVLDDASFTEQMQTPEGRAILHVKSLGPHNELERIKKRIQDSHDRRRFTNRWPGGIPPFGYRILKRYENGREAAYIELDEEMVIWLHRMREWVIANESHANIATKLNDSDVLTARDRARIARGKPTKSKSPLRKDLETSREHWSNGSIKALLTNPALLGYKKYRGEVLRNENGDPMLIADPVFTTEEWETLQTAVQARLVSTARRVNMTSPMYGAAICGGCGSNANHKISRGQKNRSGAPEYRYYVCGNWPNSRRCKGISCRAEVVEEMVEVLFLQHFGHERVTKRVWVTGSDTSRELEQVEAKIRRLKRQDEEGDWEDHRAEYRQRMDRLKIRKKELGAQPVVRSGWIAVDQGMTYLELWESLDLEGRRKQLMESSFRMVIGKGTAWPEKVTLQEALVIEGDAAEPAPVSLAE
ncbi:recombinase family protein [Streptomyces sp. SR27]|uniref:recombinase family protein n=1 Tax=Streptomyces sp. SR27 TaxID=3076630 RepID=UPI00295B5106|nr:recombinase family protein [Streptomyces sp. SR27]